MPSRRRTLPQLPQLLELRRRGQLGAPRGNAMPTPRKLADFLGVSLFMCALGYFGAIAQYSARQAVNDSRLATLEKQSPKIDAIYNALVQRGVIRLGASQPTAALELPGRSHGTSAETQTALEIVDGARRRDRSCLARRSGSISAARARHSRDGRSSGRADCRSRRTSRDREPRQAVA